jgi:carboxypeptidase family protein
VFAWLREDLLARCIVLLAVLTVACVQAAAQPVRVEIEWPPNTPTSVRENARIQAIQTAGPNQGTAAVEARVGESGPALNLSEGVWQVQASAPGYWSQQTEVVVHHRSPADVQLTFWPAASLHGVIAASAGEPVPTSIEVQLIATPVSLGETHTLKTPTSHPAQSPSRATFRCRVNAGTWNCLGPAGLFDVRLEAAGYAPHYEWGVSLKESASTDLGRIALSRTASVFGRVVRNDGSNPPAPCRAYLQPDMARYGPAAQDQESEGGPNANTRFTVALNSRGYFQVVGVTPGRYALIVACQGASAFRQSRVNADSETRIDPPLILGDSALEVNITPKIDPDGQPWHLSVYETAPHFLRIAHNVAASADGHWIRHGLMSGNYHVIVSGSDGTARLQKYFDLGRSGGVLSLQMGSLSVAGRVTMSSEPVRARLVFTNNSGGESATLVSDASGRFQGSLPVPNSSRESSWTVEAHLVQPPVTQRLLDVNVRPANDGASTWLDLDVPAVPVRGSVVSPDGNPQPNVEVVFEDSHGARTTTGTDNAGRFEMPDLPPGKYTAIADSPNGTSDRTQFDMADGSSSELRLVLNPFKRYMFDVVSNQGPVADAAVQVWIKPGVPRAFVRTDQDGRFDVNLPPGTTEIGLTIGAQGYALKLIRLPISNESNASQDAHTITLDTSAGTLLLNLRQPGPAPDDSILYLVHNGAVQDARTIAGWGSDQVNAGVNGPAVVQAIEPGAYALCAVEPASVAMLWSGQLPSDRCTKGSVEEDETLPLSPPTGKVVGSIQ